MTRLLFPCLLTLLVPSLWAQPSVRAFEGTVTVPTYEHSAREAEPPLFSTSTLTGLYPFTTYQMPYKPGPNPKEYRAIFVENEYLKLTYIPDFGGRIFSIYDKLRNREMLYRNDVIKPAPYNPRNTWPQSGMELTGPRDLHTLSLYGEPFWANKIVKNEDGSISLVLGETDPVYGMRVDLSATLHPGLAAVQISVSCYNPTDSRQPQMFWINTAISATPQTRFIYPMSRTVGHTTAEVADWPLYNGVDYSLDRNNKHMLGVFGIDIYDNFQGAYQFDRDYGIFRYADRRVVQGMKLWTFGYGEGANYEQGYTDKAGPYVELQSGRHVWDGHYEWVAPHSTENWTEWWIPVSQTGGLTTLTRDLALNLEVLPDTRAANSTISVKLAALKSIPEARLTIQAKGRKVLDTPVSLDPARIYSRKLTDLHLSADSLTGLVLTVTSPKGDILLEYHRPDQNPGRKEYTSFTRQLEETHKATEQMSAEELTLAGEYRLKELDTAGAANFFQQALKIDPGYSKAHFLTGLSSYSQGQYQNAASEFLQAIARDPYSDSAYYYLAMAQFESGKDAEAERNLYYIWPESAYFHIREYQLGRLAARKKNYAEALTHLRKATTANGYDLNAKVALSLILGVVGKKDEALQKLASVEAMDPANPLVQSQRWLLTGSTPAKAELLRLTGGQTQEAIAATLFYRYWEHWDDAAKILRLVAENGHDPWGTTPVFYYTLAYCERRAGHADAAQKTLKQAAKAAGNVDRFPYRAESLPVLREAVELSPDDAAARFNLACLLYHLGSYSDAIQQWQAAIRLSPDDFSAHRALGLAYSEQGYPAEKAAGELEKAVELKPDHLKTTYDLGSLFARAGRFKDEMKVLSNALKRSPNDDDLLEGILTANLNEGDYKDADQLIANHSFATRHRRYELRDKYRVLRYGEGAQAFHRGDYAQALLHFQAALNPPASLGVDTFAGQSSPRIEYYLGRTLEAQGKQPEAHQAYLRAIEGMSQLSGDRDSWNSENFFMIPSLDRLGRQQEAASLETKFQHFAETEMDDPAPVHRSEARYLLALIDQHRGGNHYKDLLKNSLDARPDLLAARLELRSDTLAAVPLSKP